MDMRQWFLLNDRPTADALRGLVKHIPCSDYRSPSVLKLFLAGFQCNFKLTNSRGIPTPALHLMATLMGAQLCQRRDLPEIERKGFGMDDGRLVNVLDESWYLRNITDRVRAAVSSTAMPMGREPWHVYLLPGLDGAYITYKDPDGKRRKRQCYIASCPPNWEMTDNVYKGLFRWTRECLGPPERYTGFGEVSWPDAYSLLRENQALRSAAGETAAGRHVQGACSASADSLPALTVGVQHGTAEGPNLAAGN